MNRTSKIFKNFSKIIVFFISILKTREFGIFLGLLVLFIFFSFMNPFFATLANQMNIIRQVSFMGIIAIGMTLVIVSGEFDLSVGSVYGMAGMIGGLLISNGINVWIVLLLSLASGLLIGLINGVLVTYGRIPSFIVTLGMLSIIRGFNLTVTGGYTITIVKEHTTLIGILRFLALGKLFNFIPVGGVIFIGVATIIGILYHKTIVGLHIKAVGGNAVSAMLSGIKVKNIKILAFMISGFTAAFSGILTLFFFDTAKGTTGTGLELLVITATIIGGTSLKGGVGTIFGTIIGVLIIGVLRNGLTLIATLPFWQTSIIGFVIILAVAIDIWVRGGKAPRT